MQEQSYFNVISDHYIYFGGAYMNMVLEDYHLPSTFLSVVMSNNTYYYFYVRSIFKGLTWIFPIKYIAANESRSIIDNFHECVGILIVFGSDETSLDHLQPDGHVLSVTRGLRHGSR